VKEKMAPKSTSCFLTAVEETAKPMVCKGTRPDGPFNPVNLNDDGTRTVPGSILGFDPAVFIEYVTDPKDPDFEIGFRATDSGAFNVPMLLSWIKTPCIQFVRAPNRQLMIPASARYGVIKDPQGNRISKRVCRSGSGNLQFLRSIVNTESWQ
jgi:hypothetical protein